MMSRKICVISGTRAEWYLLRNLCKYIKQDNELTLQLIVTAAHLSQDFGFTYQEIEKEFKIDKKIQVLLSNDDKIGICKSMGLLQISLCEAFEELKPDIVVILGDRYEMLSCATVAMINNIPIAHLHGGELTYGAIDDAIRHSITKMSHLHFPSTQEYANRVIQLGEHPSNVFNVGGFGVDNIKSMVLLSKTELEEKLNFIFFENTLLVTFHPVTLENNSPKTQFNELLIALSLFLKDKQNAIIFTKANADVGGKIINSMIDDFVLKHENTIAFDNMGALNYLSSMQFVKAVVGNSSSGLTEAPSFKIATINIGDRQKGRVKADSVIDVLPKKEEILKVINLVLTDEFQNSLKKVKNPYGEGDAAFKTKEILKNAKLKDILKKEFCDIF
ncbi:TPA: UDP-N-acetylglucosamine 2-epimerase (hydrolyzing) [Campylobacter lari]|nr:UDP-N-acetylglucosamine 2-epimerase (hydrolyzing) [Campylobacter lari]